MPFKAPEPGVERLPLPLVLIFSLPTIPLSALGLAMGVYLAPYFASHLGVSLTGVGLAFIDVNILEAALLIGLATTTMVTIGVMVGRVLGHLIGKRAEIIGGVVLIGVGAAILYEHLSRAGG